jgi:SAM-dependent methyltransferase
MWDSTLHGGEVAGGEVAYLMAKWVLENSTFDPNARRILERNYLIFIPVINVDTYNRQNMRRVYDFGNGTVVEARARTNAISSLRETARRRQLRNLVLRVGRAEDTVLCESCADIVFFANDLHDFEDPNKVLANAMKMLKPSGRLVDVDWKKKKKKKKNMMITGPPLQIRLSEEEAGILIRTNGFEVETVEEAGPYHYMIVAKRAKEL